MPTVEVWSILQDQDNVSTLQVFGIHKKGVEETKASGFKKRPTLAAFVGPGGGEERREEQNGSDPVHRTLRTQTMEYFPRVRKRRSNLQSLLLFTRSLASSGASFSPAPTHEGNRGHPGALLSLILLFFQLCRLSASWLSASVFVCSFPTKHEQLQPPVKVGISFPSVPLRASNYSSISEEVWGRGRGRYERRGRLSGQQR